MDRHKKIGWQGKHHAVYATQNYLIFPSYLDSFSFLSALWSHPQRTLKLLNLAKTQWLSNFHCFCLQTQQNTTTQHPESSRPNCSIPFVFLHTSA